MEAIAPDSGAVHSAEWHSCSGIRICQPESSQFTAPHSEHLYRSTKGCGEEGRIETHRRRSNGNSATEALVLRLMLNPAIRSSTEVGSNQGASTLDLGMATKLRSRKHLEAAIYLSIDCLSLARMPAGWRKRGKVMRAVKIQHRLHNRTTAETDLRAEFDETAGAVTLKHRGIDGMVIEHSVLLEPIRQHFGGQRWFFLCPRTGARARKLYRYPGMLEFSSRLGLQAQVSYRSQRDSGAKRVMRQIWDLRAKVGDTHCLLGTLDQPQGMSGAEYIRYAIRYLELADRLDFSTRGFNLRRIS